MAKSSFIVLLCPLQLLGAAVVTPDGPGACLLQQGTSQVQRAVALQEFEQHPEHHHHKDQDDSKEKRLDKYGKGSNREEKKGYGGEKQHDETGNPEDNKEKKKDSEDDGPKPEAQMASLRLEVHLAISMKELKRSNGRQLGSFLEKLHEGLAKAADIPRDRLDVLGVRGDLVAEGVAYDSKATPKESQKRRSHSIVDDVLAERSHSIVDVEVLPGPDTEQLSAKAVFLRLQDKFKDDDSDLMAGALHKRLKGAKITVGEGVEIDDSGSVAFARLGLPVLAGLLYFFQIL